jgi:lipoprotein-anchoring transpeptidase ErfK/SrfK
MREIQKSTCGLCGHQLTNYAFTVTPIGVDIFRLRMLRHISELDSFANSWSSWKPEITGHLGTSPSAQDVFDLGDHLSEVFRSNAVVGRDNAAVSQGGVAWECLVCWYLNLVLWGTDTIAIRPHANFLPSVVKDALTVSIQNVQTNTESDLVVLSIPGSKSHANLDLNGIDMILRTSAGQVAISVVQCKTNWNDNSQIPMLWDLIYNSSSFRVPNVSIGRDGVSPTSFKTFSYAFVTVPTSRGDFTPTKLPALRVRGLTGGNYWGHPSKAGVARSIKEFFTANFATSFQGTIQNHIASSLLKDPAALTAFLDLQF